MQSVDVPTIPLAPPPPPKARRKATWPLVIAVSVVALLVGLAGGAAGATAHGTTTTVTVPGPTVTAPPLTMTQEVSSTECKSALRFANNAILKISNVLGSFDTFKMGQVTAWIKANAHDYKVNRDACLYG